MQDILKRTSKRLSQIKLLCIPNFLVEYLSKLHILFAKGDEIQNLRVLPSL